MKNILLPFCCSFFLSANAQTNVRAWYADGQVWVVWETTAPLPDWYAVYAKPTAFSSTANAVLIGKLHQFEYLCAALKEQIDTAVTPRIPNPTGPGKYQLAANEGLFVFTPHQAGVLFFAVVADGETAVTAGQNITATATTFQYNPTNDPVECHLQATFPSPFANGFACLAYMMWADGRQNQWESRPDFPIMANGAKNGMPSLFFISVPAGIDTTQPFPMSIWLHGGGGTARQSLAGSRAEINIRPVEGILLAHDDNLMGWRDQIPPFPDLPTWHFGWRKNYDPFTPGNLPIQEDTIVNYTQRRYLWTDAWLMRHFNIDSARIHLHGHSMGSAGATALAKCYPEHYASATIFNNGFGGPDPGSNVTVLGEPTLNFPTNLKNRAGEAVHLLSLFNLLDNCADARDLPLIRHWHSKNDDNGTMQWDPYVVENYRKADSSAWEFKICGANGRMGRTPDPITTTTGSTAFCLPSRPQWTTWVLQKHVFEATSLFPLFSTTTSIHKTTTRVQVCWASTMATATTGAPGVATTAGIRTIVTETGGWSVVAWLESNAVFSNDNCPNNSLTADVAIRRPQIFKPATGTLLNWSVRDAGTGNVLQSGQVAVQDDDLVVIPQVVVFRENIRRVRITVVDPSVATAEPQRGISSMAITPNPASDVAVLAFENHTPAKEAELRIIASTGNAIYMKIPVLEDENRVPLAGFEHLPAGIYMVEINLNGQRGAVKWVKM
ncbi:MAG: hypothetical protein IPL27_13035 [Lewinellaceae bacterium]|nr:hypothetical protein [Lewinellaceae bacterium]